MSDRRARQLDFEIMAFIKKYRDADAPEIVFEWLALKIFDHQFQKNLHYRKYCLYTDKIPGRVCSWKEIPAMPAAAFKEKKLTAFPIKNTKKVFYTSGTMSSDKGAHYFDTLNLYEHSIVPSFEKYLRPDGASLAAYFLISSMREAPHSSLSFMMQVLRRRFAPSGVRCVIQNGAGQFDKLTRELKKETKKVLLLSTALALAAYLEFLAKKKINISLPSGSRLMETGGFKGRARAISRNVLLQRCEKYLGISKTHCVGEYGMTELSSQAYDSILYDKVLNIKRKTVKIGPAWMRTMVIDPLSGLEAKKGRPGLLRHVDLANRGSVMAVQTEDLGRAVGDGFELLGRAKNAELRGCSMSYESWMRSTS